MAALIAIAVPLVVSNACDTLMIFTGRLFLAKLGPEYMSAAMSGGLSAFMFQTFFIGLTGYTNALVAQYLGAGRPKQCGAAAGQGLLVSLGAYPLVLACIPVGHALFSAVGVPAKQLPLQNTYFTLLMFGSIFSLLRNVMSSFFSGIGRTRIVMIATGTSLTVNVAAVYVLVFGKLGFPPLAMAGAAIGTVFADAIGLMVLALAYFRHEQRKSYGTASGLRLDRQVMAKLVRFGSPAGFELMLNLTAFNLLVMCFHSRGIAVAAAATVAFNWDMVSFIPLLGVNVGVSSLVGRFMGAQDSHGAHRAAMSGLKLVSSHAAILLLLCSLFPATLTGVFVPPSDTEAWTLAVFMVRLVSVYVFADAIGLVFSGALRGAGDTVATMCISVAFHWLLLAVTVVLLRVVKVAPQIAWTVLVLMIWVLAGALLLRYRGGRWRSLRVVDEQPNVVAAEP
jgi:multidrug resistance protein, MATE family